jgi:hypothetical protein
MSAAEDRINRSMNRFDLVSGALAMRLQQQIRADAAAEAEEERDRLRRNAERCRQLQERYDSSFAAFGKRSPPPKADAKPRSYRTDLFRTAAAMLPSTNELTKLTRDDLEDLPNGAFTNFENDLIEALAAEGEKPSRENTPADGSLIARHRTDDATGLRSTEWYGRRSFIADMGRPGRRVLRIVNPKTGDVLLGRPFPSVRPVY